MLKAIKPGEVKPSRVKMLISGDPGVGKTFFALEWPAIYLIDTEGGAVRKQYQEKLKKVGGLYFGQEQGAGDFNHVIEEIKALATTQHDRKTLIIDSFSHLYVTEAAEAELKIGSDFGKDKKEANKPTRQLMKWINKCDMNVLLIAHNKAKWARKGNDIYQDGNTFEGYPKMEYDLDLFIEIMPGHKTFLIKKSRIESLPQGESMPLSYDKFAEVYGQDILSADSHPAELATKDQLIVIGELIIALNIQEDQIAKWFKKVDVDSWEEMTTAQIQSLIDMLEEKIAKLNQTKKPEIKNGKKEKK